jgi:quinol monooxygenase YgiN
MSQVRVVVTSQASSVAEADEAIQKRVEICERVQAEEEGCLQYEVYRSAMRSECWVLLELWASKAIYDKHWHLQQKRERATPRRRGDPPPRAALLKCITKQSSSASMESGRPSTLRSARRRYVGPNRAGGQLVTVFMWLRRRPVAFAGVSG